jgi:hypothetical protein
MYNISVRRACEEGYGIVAIGGRVLEFTTEDEARQWGIDNIENKSTWIVSWFVSKA